MKRGTRTVNETINDNLAISSLPRNSIPIWSFFSSRQAITARFDDSIELTSKSWTKNHKITTVARFKCELDLFNLEKIKLYFVKIQLKT
ncbi:MAG: hypothetical protein ACFFAS_16865 [Promethearchaeota archaeon]